MLHYLPDFAVAYMKNCSVKPSIQVPGDNHSESFFKWLMILNKNFGIRVYQVVQWLKKSEKSKNGRIITTAGD